jgi:hypothetical protein
MVDDEGVQDEREIRQRVGKIVVHYEVIKRDPKKTTYFSFIIM